MTPHQSGCPYPDCPCNTGEVVTFADVAAEWLTLLAARDLAVAEADGNPCDPEALKRLVAAAQAEGEARKALGLALDHGPVAVGSFRYDVEPVTGIYRLSRTVTRIGDPGPIPRDGRLPLAMLQRGEG